MKHAIDLLRRQVTTSEHNAGIAHGEQRYTDEVLALETAADCRLALDYLEEAKPSAAEIAALQQCQHCAARLAWAFLDEPELFEHRNRTKGLMVFNALGTLCAANTPSRMAAAIGGVHKACGVPSNYTVDTMARAALQGLYEAGQQLAIASDPALAKP